MSSNTDDLLREMREEARESAGDGTTGSRLFVGPEPGEFALGVWAGVVTREVPFGRGFTEMVRLVNVTTNTGELEPEREMFVDCTGAVLRDELLPPGTAPNQRESKSNPAPVPGMWAYIEFTGHRTSKTGNAYPHYLVRLRDGDKATAELATRAEAGELSPAAEKPNPGPASPKADDPEGDIPFRDSRV